MRRAILIGALIACGGDSDVSRLLGARCDVTADCDDRCLAPSTDYPDGFCTADCSENDECPERSDCIDRDGGVCLFTCELDDDCVFLGPGWTCHEDGLREDPNVRSRVCRG